MTGPNDSAETRPISVAELLARNGTIGAPPLGGRRRRRRGNTDAVTVAELTGEIPIVGSGEPHTEPDQPDDGADNTETSRLAVANGLTEPGPAPVAEPLRPEPHDDEAPPAYDPGYDDYLESIRGHPRARVRAEQMRPDPVEEDEHHELAVDEPGRPADEPADEDADLPSYLRGQREHLFGGSEHATDLMPQTPPAKTAAPAPITPMTKALRAGWVVLQSIIAVAFGAGLFLGFDQLWRWNSIVALVLSVLVIIGLVVAVRIVRKTEDIGSTLIAVAVGALVTLGPLALLQSN
jgi:hypothetical protein